MIVRQGDAADAFFVVCDGSVSVTVDGETPAWGGKLEGGNEANFGATFGRARPP